MHGKQKYREAGYSTPPPPPPLLNFLGEKPPLRHTNGYSIAEILLVFGIIAGVLIGVWAMYTMLSDEADVKTAVAEIQIIREAAVQFKTHDGNGKYDGMTLATFGSYLGDGIAQDMDRGGSYGIILTNTFGGPLTLKSDRFRGTGGGNLLLRSILIPSMNICRRILEHFGEVQAITSENEGIGGGTTTDYYIPVGKSIFGYVGAPDQNGSGCTYQTDYGYGQAKLNLRID